VDRKGAESLSVTNSLTHSLCILVEMDRILNLISKVAEGEGNAIVRDRSFFCMFEG